MCFVAITCLFDSVLNIQVKKLGANQHQEQFGVQDLAQEHFNMQTRGIE